MQRSSSDSRKWTAAELAEMTHSSKKGMRTTVVPVADAAGELKARGGSHAVR